MIDLFSDTVTRPSVAMRQAMAAAEVGDEQRKLDPSAAALAQRLEQEGVSVSVYGPTTLRGVTHLDVSQDDVDRAISIVRKVMM